MFIKFADDIWLENVPNLLEDGADIQSTINKMP